MEDEDRPKRISFFKIICSIFFNILRIISPIYVQYLFFYRDADSEVYYLSTLTIYFISAAIKMCFAVRILINNKDNIFKPLFSSAFVFLIINQYFAKYKSQSNFEYIFSSKILKIFFEQITPLLLVFLQVPPFFMQILATKYAIQCKLAEINNNKEDQEKFYESHLRAESDADCMSELECYLRASPQQILHIAIVFYNHGDFTKVSVIQQLSIIFAFAMMLWTNTSFQETFNPAFNPMQQKKKTKLIYFIGRFCIMAPMIFSIGAAMAFWPILRGTLIFGHWLVAVLWFWWKTKPTEFNWINKFFEILSSMALGAIYFFTPTNLINDLTTCQYFWLFSITVIENVTGWVLWYSSENVMALKYKLAIVGIIGIAFAIGIFLTVLLYNHKEFHPNKSVNVEANEDVELAPETLTSDEKDM